MSKCPFLTTTEEDVSCFKECVLYKWPDNDGKCPFKMVKKIKKFTMVDLYEYDAFRDDKESPISLIYGNI